MWPMCSSTLECGKWKNMLLLYYIHTHAHTHQLYSFLEMQVSQDQKDVLDKIPYWRNQHRTDFVDKNGNELFSNKRKPMNRCQVKKCDNIQSTQWKGNACHNTKTAWNGRDQNNHHHNQTLPHLTPFLQIIPVVSTPWKCREVCEAIFGIIIFHWHNMAKLFSVITVYVRTILSIWYACCIHHV
jgi:hypothetical protein